MNSLLRGTSSVGPQSSNSSTGSKQKILPIMSGPQSRNTQQPQNQKPSGISGINQLRQSTGNHRRKPPEESSSFYQKPADTRDTVTTTMQPPSFLITKRPGSGQSGMESGDSGNSSMMDFDPTHPDFERYMASAIGGASKALQFDSSGGSGNSSGGEGKMLDPDSSGSSGQSRLTRRSTAQDWFNTFNRDVSGNQSFPNYDNDSPYYMTRKKHQPAIFRHTRPSDPLPIGFDASKQMTGMPHGMLESTEESNSESFRSVIDDLTIKNQKLKKRLRKLEGLRGRDQGERLFEVRIHDLPEGKKNELERLLQKFSASLDPNHVPSGTSSGNNIAAADQSTTPGGGDSGYNTMPRPGDSPMGISSSHGSKSSDQLRPWPNAQTNVELSKMKTVVKKLEQLFTGGDPMMNDRTQLLQQQDISNTAAADDREARIAHGEFMDPEGAREASLMSPVPYNVQTNYQTAGEPKMQISGNSSPVEAEEQRPTRPLDLDPSRRQVAEDNIEYLTHMTESSTKGFGIGGGWVYLNLIINLAQLHTINVTPPFVKKAIATASNKIELSPDGKMVRWRGGCEGTLFGGSSNADSGCMSGDNSGDQSPPNHAEQAAKAARKQTSQVGSSNSGLAQDKSQNSPSSADSKFHYKPIFAQSQSFDDESSSAMTSSDSDSNDALKRNGSEDYVNGVPKKQTGPIIYYKGGNFCTDLSATPPGPGSPPAALHSYERVTNRPLGAKSDTAGSPGTKTSSPLYQAQLSQMSDDDAMDLDRHDVPIEFQPEFTAVSPTSPRPPIEFEVSGIGGVLPADNFAINCQTKHYLLPESHGRLPLSRTRTFKSKVQKRIPHRIPQASIDAFYDEDQATDSSGTSTTSVSRVPRVTRIPTRPSRKRPLRHELLSAKTLKLPPSQLPPASYIFASPSEESSYGETDSDEPPQSMNSDEYYFNMAALPPHAYRSSSGEENESGPSGFERSPSSAATAGDGSVAGSVFSVASAADENTFDAPLSMDDEDQSSSAGSSGNGFTMFPPGRYMNLLAGDERPQLKRPRGSVYSSTSTNQVRKSARTGTMSTMSTSS